MLYRQILKRDVTEEEYAKSKQKKTTHETEGKLAEHKDSGSKKKKIFWETGNFDLQLRD